MTVAAAREAIPIGRRERRKSLTRRELLHAARKLFSAKGLYESRIEEITEKAGIAKGTLYKYFESKQSLVRDVVEAGFEELWNHIDRMTAGCRRPEMVARLVEAHYEYFALNPDMLRILHQVRGLLKFNRSEWRPLRDVLATHVDRLADRLGPSGSTERIGPEARRDLAILIFGSVSGTLSVRASLDPGGALGKPPPELTRALVAMARDFGSRPGRVAERGRRR